MPKYDIRFVLRTTQDFIRQSGWLYNTAFTQNDKAVITATWDNRCSRISCAGKLTKDLKILLAFPQFDFHFSTLHDGSLIITIDKRLTPKKIPHHAATDGVRQQALNLIPLNLYRRKKDASDTTHSRNRTS
jgi:hypothetical protein